MTQLQIQQSIRSSILCYITASVEMNQKMQALHNEYLKPLKYNNEKA